MNKQSTLRIPRVILIVFICFISLFALDVFEQGTVLEKIFGLLIHLIPTYVLIAILLISRKRPIAAGTLLLVLGVLFTFYFRTYDTWLNFATQSMPIFVDGVLFIIFC